MFILYVPTNVFKMSSVCEEANLDKRATDIHVPCSCMNSDCAWHVNVAVHGQIKVWAPEHLSSPAPQGDRSRAEYSLSEITDLRGSWWEMSLSTKMEL